MKQAQHTCLITAGDMSLHHDDIGSAPQAATKLTLESGLFPCLFPTCTGCYDGAMQFTAYCKMRMEQAFSPFTLDPVYVLVMYQVRQAKVLLRYCQKEVRSPPEGGGAS